MRASVAVVAGVALLAGCGNAPARVTPPRATGDGRPAGVSATPHDRSAAANRERAEREAARLLALARVPPGAVRTSTPPSDLSMPVTGRPVVRSLVDKAAFWRISMGFDAALAWLRAHPPAGLRHTGTSSGSGPGIRTAGDSYDEPAGPGIAQPQFEIGVARIDAATTAIRADGMAMWLDPRPYRDTASGLRIRVTVSGGCPADDRHVVGVRNTGADLRHALVPKAAPAAGLVCVYWGMNGTPFRLGRSFVLGATDARRVAAAARAVDLAHVDGGVTSCPMGDGAAMVVALRYPGRADVDVWYLRNGCQSVANGYIWTAPGTFTAAVARYSRTMTFNPAGSRSP